ncbi:hypothetical protein ABLZ23_000501 [Salmonella enterica]|nr:hypothetical protein [Salmonella enterica]EBP7965642.1 hypothetical protein [Salmonella enterica]EEJ1163110.1 hypothetical protein [Salmonella enterica]EEU9070320.1 hypothetical protein [Salmonella enterica]EKN5824005.1 hypothetical protein [Salmonella enterica]
MRVKAKHFIVTLVLLFCIFFAYFLTQKEMISCFWKGIAGDVDAETREKIDEFDKSIIPLGRDYFSRLMDGMNKDNHQR